MAYPMARWRLLNTGAADGATNMAIDEAILRAVVAGLAPPTLRFYAWQPPCLSLGQAQPSSEVDGAACAARGYHVVRRPTGGRAILHTDELTYSVAGPQDEPRLAGGVLESYRVLAQALLYALHLLGIPAQAEEKPGSATAPAGPANQNPVCFEVPSNYEITVGGKKLIGSAQARRQQGVLQHGSLPLYGDLTRIVQALAFPDAAARDRAAGRLLERATTAERILGRPLVWDRAALAFADAFAERLNIQLQPAELSPQELERATALMWEKYANPAWTARM